MKNEKKILQITEEAAGMRLDKFLSDNLDGFTRSRLQNLILDGKILLDGLPVGKTGKKLKSGQEITIEIPPAKKLAIKAEDIPLDIYYEDDDLIVVNKSQGMVVHPSKGHDAQTLVNALLFHCHNLSGINGILRPGIVHRLDKDTSGLIVVAKNDNTHLHLAEQFKDKETKREYLALVYGHPSAKEGTIDAPLGRHPRERKRIAVSSSATARQAVTHFSVLEKFQETSLLRLRLETGRTHQIRVHMQYIGYPVLGDRVYGRRKDKFNLPGQALHACYLGFEHPTKRQFMELKADPPQAFQDLLAVLRGEGSLSLAGVT